MLPPPPTATPCGYWNCPFAVPLSPHVRTCSYAASRPHGPVGTASFCEHPPIVARHSSPVEISTLGSARGSVALGHIVASTEGVGRDGEEARRRTDADGPRI